MNKPLSSIEISESALINNYLEFRKFLNKKIDFAGVVKGNAYGHGQYEVIKILDPYVDYFQVDDIDELKRLRRLTNKPCLVLGYIQKDEIRKALKLGCILSAYDIDHLKLMFKEGARLRITPEVHIKIDANLGRQGVLLKDLEEFLVEAKKINNLHISGVYSHFANIEDTNDRSHAWSQIKSLEIAIKLFKKYGFKNLKKHISATSGVLFDQNILDNDIARIGIGLYGMWPSEELKNNFQDKIRLQPVIKWVTHIAQIKNLPKGYSIGYGLTYITTKPTTIAVIPQGYSDGYDRGLSNMGEVLIHGKRCPVLGRVAMNMFVVDVTNIKNVHQEDEVVLLGMQDNESITAEELARKTNTINYEITSKISSLLPRIISSDK